MIFLTVGTHEPFDRLVRAVDDWAGARGAGTQIFGQITARAAYRPRHFTWQATLDPADFRARLASASLIVSHAGMGTILSALAAGTPVAVMPRRGHLGETRNDHQQATVLGLGTRPGLYVAADEAALGPLLDRLAGGAAAPEPIRPFAEDSLIAAVRSAILA